MLSSHFVLVLLNYFIVMLDQGSQSIDNSVHQSEALVTWDRHSLDPHTRHVKNITARDPLDEQTWNKGKPLSLLAVKSFVRVFLVSQTRSTTK